MRLLDALAKLEINLGRLNEAVTHSLQAQVLDPRSADAAGTLATALHMLRRYPEALQAYEHVRALKPQSLLPVELQAMVHLAEGDLTGARTVLASATKDVDSTKLTALVANAWDLAWVLDSAQQDLVLQQPWETFDENPVYRTIIHAQIYYLRGDHKRTRAYADSARRGFDEVLRTKPYLTKADQYALRGLALAYLGAKTQAMHEGERGVMRALQVGYPWDTGYIRGVLARIYVVLDEPNKALDQLQVLLTTPSYFAPGWFQIDPNFAPLRGNPRFERLVAKQ